MSQARPATVDRRATARLDAAAAHERSPRVSIAAQTDIGLTVHDDLRAAEKLWREFEQRADCTVFQTYDWLAIWQRNIGVRNDVTPAVVVGRQADGNVLFLLPLAVEPGRFARRLRWLGGEQNDYNAPLLARDFARHVTPERFVALWREVTDLIQRHPRLRHDVVELDKMPETIGAQANPFRHLRVGLHPSGAYLARLGESWDEFYAAKRSSATRQRDRSKRKRLGELGEVRFVTVTDRNEIGRTLDTLIAQKTRSFAKMGVANIFAPPGQREFLLDLATNPAVRPIVHVSRLDVGPIVAAANLGLVFRGRYYYLLASHDDGPAWRFGPGVAHLHDLLRYAIERRLDEFDFTVGDESYKRDWHDSLAILYDHVAAASLRGQSIALLAVGKRRLKRLIKQTPVLWRTFSAARALAGPLRGRPSDGESDHA